MARRRTEEDEISLFPFLSILACLIGTLVLMIMAVALSQLDTGVVAVAEAYAKVRAELSSHRVEVDDLAKTVAERQSQGAAQQRRLAAAQAELAELQRKAAAAKAPAASPKAPPSADAEHQRRMAEIKKELDEAQRRLKQKEAELAQKKLPPGPAPVVIRPTGSGVDLRPTFVECTARGLVVYDPVDKPYQVGGAIRTDAKYVQLLERIAKEPKASLIFLVRSDGLGAYSAASTAANEKSARNGKLPVVGQGPLDLSLFHAK